MASWLGSRIGTVASGAVGQLNLSSITGQLSTYAKDILIEGTEETSDYAAEASFARDKLRDVEAANEALRTELERAQSNSEDMAQRLAASEMQVESISREYRRLLVEKESENAALKSRVAELNDQLRARKGEARKVASSGDLQALVAVGADGFSPALGRSSIATPVEVPSVIEMLDEGEDGSGGAGASFGEALSTQLEIDRLSVELRNALDDAAHWRNVADEAEARTRLLERQLSERQESTGNGADNAEAVASRYEEMLGSLRRQLDAAVAKHQAEMEGYRDVSAAMVAEARRADAAEIARLQEMIDDQASTIESLEGTVQQLHADKRAAKESHTQLERELVSVRESLRLAEANESHVQTERELVSLRESLRAAEAELAPLRESLRSSETERMRLTAELEHARSVVVVADRKEASVVEREIPVAAVNVHAPAAPLVRTASVGVVTDAPELPTRPVVVESGAQTDPVVTKESDAVRGSTMADGGNGGGSYEMRGHPDGGVRARHDAEVAALKEALTRGEQQLERLRAHLLEVEQSRTLEAVELEGTNKELVHRVRELESALAAEKAAAARSRAVAESAVSDREAMAAGLKETQMALVQKDTAVQNLQLVLEQFQREQEQQVEMATLRLRKEKALLQSEKDALDKRVSELEAVLSRSTAEAAEVPRLRSALEEKESTLLAAKSELSKAQRELKSSYERLHTTLTSTDQNSLDRRFIKSLIRISSRRRRTTSCA
eukprot:Opistho-1_new@84175